MRSVAPRTGAPEVSIAQGQEEYLELTGAVHHGGEVLVTRWRFSDEDRARVAAGEDLYLAHLTFGGPFQPIIVQVGAEGLPE